MVSVRPFSAPRLVAGALLALAMTGCATLQPGPRAEVQTPVASTLPVVLVVQQQEIVPDVPATATAVGAQFGLIGALVGASVQSSQARSADERIGPLRDQMVGAGLSEAFEQAFREGLDPAQWGAVEFTTTTGPGPMVPQRRTLVLTGRYALSYEADHAYVSLIAQVFDPNPKRPSRPVLAYYNTFFYIVPIPGATGDKDENDIAARAYGGERLTADLRAGVDELVRMANYDVGAFNETYLGERRAVQGAVGFQAVGHLIRVDGDRTWVRGTSGGPLMSVPSE